MNISINLSAVSNLGCVRSNNEDMALITGTILRDNEYSARFKINDSSRFTAIVADGMGGYGGGEIASEMAIRAFDQFILNLPPDLDNIPIQAHSYKFSYSSFVKLYISHFSYNE